MTSFKTSAYHIIIYFAGGSQFSVSRATALPWITRILKEQGFRHAGTPLTHVPFTSREESDPGHPDQIPQYRSHALPKQAHIIFNFKCCALPSFGLCNPDRVLGAKGSLQPYCKSRGMRDCLHGQRGRLTPYANALTKVLAGQSARALA